MPTVKAPPPAPPRREDELAREQLVRELRALETPDLLALCLRGKSNLQRLRLYLSLFRGRAGTRAQLAACLVCFDLARLGEETAQREFLALASTIEALSRDGKLVQELLGTDPYLQATWAACRLALESEDQRSIDSLALDDAELLGEVELLTDADIDFDLEDAQLEEQERTEQAKEEFGAILSLQLGQDSARGVFAAAGFETGSTDELDRLEGFLKQAVSYADRVSTARGMASLGYLFLATHLRLKTLFGKRNARRAAALKSGLVRLPADLDAVIHAAAIFELESGTAMEGFEKVLELLIDFIAFCHQGQLDPRAAASADAYVEAERQPPPVLLTGSNRRRRG
jgi:hypothetical protein